MVVGSWGMLECFKTDAEAPWCSRQVVQTAAKRVCEVNRNQMVSRRSTCRLKGNSVASVYCWKTKECEDCEVKGTERKKSMVELRNRVRVESETAQEREEQNDKRSEAMEPLQGREQ